MHHSKALCHTTTCRLIIAIDGNAVVHLKPFLLPGETEARASQDIGKDLACATGLDLWGFSQLLGASTHEIPSNGLHLYFLPVSQGCILLSCLSCCSSPDCMRSPAVRLAVSVSRRFCLEGRKNTFHRRKPRITKRLVGFDIVRALCAGHTNHTNTQANQAAAAQEPQTRTNGSFPLTRSCCSPESGN